MRNFISINGTVTELTDERVQKLLAKMEKEAAKTQLSEIAVGDTFEIGEHEFVVLEQSGDTTAVIRKELLSEQEFGNTNNFNGSDVEETSDEFATEIEAIIGMKNIVEHTVDLTSNDGLKDYGTIKSRASLLTADLYRRYIEILDKFKPDGWWWLSTPFSTKTHENDYYVLCVSPSGRGLCSRGRGVRPFCILKSTIFVSK